MSLYSRPQNLQRNVPEMLPSNFVVAAVRVVHARVQKKRPQVCVLPPAVDAVERSAGVTLEKRMLALVRAARMMIAGVPKKRRRIAIFLSAVFAVLAHVI